MESFKLIMKISEIKYLIPSFLNHGNISNPITFEKKYLDQKLSKFNLVFVASTGREGSNFISNIFSNIPNIYSCHEQRPFFNGQKTISKSLDGSFSNDYLLKVKLSDIFRSLHKSRTETYIESNHMFLKTFGKGIINNYNFNFDLISLRRPIVKTLRSFHELGWFDSRFTRAQNWIYKVNQNSPLKRTNLKIKDSLDECLSYIVSEKMNEVRFLYNNESRIDRYFRVNIPSKKNDIHKLLNYYSPNISNFVDFKPQNKRDDVKVNQSSSQEIRDRALGFFEKNYNSFISQGIEFHKDDLCLVIGDERWELVD